MIFKVFLLRKKACRFCFFINLTISYYINISFSKNKKLSVELLIYLYSILHVLNNREASELVFLAMMCIRLNRICCFHCVQSMWNIFWCWLQTHTIGTLIFQFSKIYRLNLLPFRRTKSLYGVMPNCKFGPCGSILDDSATSL